MTVSPDLWLFFVLVLGIVVLPGMDMAFVLSNTLATGLASGAAAIAGIVCGGVVHLALGATGAAALLLLWPLLFNALLLAGGLYVGWLGLGLLRVRSAVLPEWSTASLPAPVVFRRGLLTSLLNPKAYAFVLSVYPVFLRTEARPWVVQAALLGLITAATQILVYGGMAAVASRLSAGLPRHQVLQLRITRGVGAVLLLAAAVSIVTGWRSL